MRMQHTCLQALMNDVEQDQQADEEGSAHGDWECQVHWEGRLMQRIIVPTCTA